MKIFLVFIVVLLTSCGEQKTSSPPPVDINEYLVSHPTISSKIIWGNPGSSGATYLPWSQWTEQQQADLSLSFTKAYKWYFFNLSNGSDDIANIPTNVGYSSSQYYNPEFTVIEVEYAWQLYTRWIAHTLVLEIYQIVPWSITTYDEESLHILLDASRMMTPRGTTFELTSENHSSDQFRKTLPGRTTLSTPIYTFKFLTTNNIFKNVLTSRQAIENLLQWCNRTNMSHYGYYPTFGNMFAHWQYYGAAPFVRIAEGTVSTAPRTPLFSHWTAGCHGTSGFLKYALRAINIPVELSQVCGHSLPIFRTEHVFLSHGDDPYSAIGLGIYSMASLPVAGLLVPDNYYQEWFGVDMYSEVNVVNEGTNPWPDQLCSLIGVGPRMLTGIVSSPTGKVSNATVDLMSEVTSVSTRVKTDSTGTFSLVTMPGNYQVTISSVCCTGKVTQTILLPNYPKSFAFNFK